MYVIYIVTTREELWAALTQGELSREYWGGRIVESDWQPGSPVRSRRADGELDIVRAQVIEVEPVTKRWARRAMSRHAFAEGRSPARDGDERGVLADAVW